MATQITLGASSLSSWSHLVAIAASPVVNPVTFPPGWERLSENPKATGSFPNVYTIGIVRRGLCRRSRSERFCEDHGHPTLNKFRRERRESINLARHAIFDDYITALHVAHIAQALAERERIYIQEAAIA